MYRVFSVSPVGLGGVGWGGVGRGEGRGGPAENKTRNLDQDWDQDLDLHQETQGPGTRLILCCEGREGGEIVENPRVCCRGIQSILCTFLVCCPIYFEAFPSEKKVDKKKSGEIAQKVSYLDRPKYISGISGDFGRIRGGFRAILCARSRPKTPEIARNADFGRIRALFP